MTMTIAQGLSTSLLTFFVLVSVLKNHIGRKLCDNEAAQEAKAQCHAVFKKAETRTTQDPNEDEDELVDADTCGLKLVSTRSYPKTLTHTLMMINKSWKMHFFLAVVLLLSHCLLSVNSQGSPRIHNRNLDTAAPMKPRQVVVVLKDASVSEVRASLKRKTDRHETDAIVKELQVNQAALVSAVNMCGGTVVHQYQHALNGMRVLLSSDQDEEQLRSLADVVDVLPIRMYHRMNVESVPLLGVPKIWNLVPQGLGLHGEGIKVAIIDTGIDYTHANFGGPGTVDAYNAASGTSTQSANASWFGPSAPKVKGGYDFAGDDYDGSNDPTPDPNPLDCDGHGSHVAGTAGGFGVKADGTTFTGPYNESIYTPNAFLIGPGVAPKVDLYAYRVFGCMGGTNLVVDAIDRAIADDVDVINMSLGGDFGIGMDAVSLATNNAVRAGVIVVAAAGNSGPIPYITAAPATADGALSVAAIDSSHATLPGANITMLDGKVFSVLHSNDISFADGTPFTVLQIYDDPSTPDHDESLGCVVGDFPSPIPSSTLLVVNRGVCGHVDKAINGQQAGAAAVILINNAPGYPPFEGSQPGLTIPFFGADISDGPAFEQYDGTQLTVKNTILQNPSFLSVTSFSSGGPRFGDSFLKPEISAPGESISSTAVGTGYQGITYSGTSMASPYVAGVAALVRQAHPSWSVVEIKAAIISTASPSNVTGFDVRLAGAGLVNPLSATQTSVWASGLVSSDHYGSVAVNFGYVELTSKLYVAQSAILIRNRGSLSVTFSVRVDHVNGVPHTLSVKKTRIQVAPFKNATLYLTLQVPAATAGNSRGFFDASGTVVLTPLGTGNNGIVLSVPYYIVPRSVSTLSASIKPMTTSASNYSVSLSNSNGAMACQNVTFFSWGIHCYEPTPSTFTSVRAVGVRSESNPSGDVDDPLIRFSVNTYQRWSSPSGPGFRIVIDVDPQNMNGDDYFVEFNDVGYLTGGYAIGTCGTFVKSTRSDDWEYLDPELTFASTDSSVAIRPLLSSYLCRETEPCLSPDNPRFSYRIESYSIEKEAYVPLPGRGSFNPFSPSISFSSFSLGPIVSGKTSESNLIQVNKTEWDMTPALGVLVVASDNKAGKDQALELAIVKPSSRPTKTPMVRPTKKPK